MAYQFKAHVIITGQIKCLTGLHIGGTEEGYEIGGMDNPVIKDKITGFPYIPGSSIKGKMRSLSEWALGKVGETERDGQRVREIGSVHVCSDPQCKVCRIFGTSADRRGKEGEAAGPTRLVIRDAYLSKETLDDPRYLNAGVFTMEVKTENSLNRITSAANPRPMERVPQGAKFDLEMIYGIYDVKNDGGKTDVDNLEQISVALEMLEASVLGGGGSRGSGRVVIENPQATIKSLKDYQTQALTKESQGITIQGETVGDVIAKVREYFA